MPSYGPQFKEQIVKKLMPPYNQSVAQVSRDTGVAVRNVSTFSQQIGAFFYVTTSGSSVPTGVGEIWNPSGWLSSSAAV